MFCFKFSIVALDDSLSNLLIYAQKWCAKDKCVCVVGVSTLCLHLKPTKMHLSFCHTLVDTILYMHGFFNIFIICSMSGKGMCDNSAHMASCLKK
jgi:hypothetical protein